MAKHQRAPQDKQADIYRKHRKKRQQKSQNPYDKSLTHDKSLFPGSETPFHPRIDEHAATLSRIPFSAQRQEFISRLQHTYGNRYVQRLMESMKVQAKLTVSDPNDIYEQEADKVAEEVTRSVNTPVLRREPEEDEELMQGKLVQRQAPEEDEELIQGSFDIQRQEPEEEELLQGKFAQRQAPEEEEELIQGSFDIQRQEPEEEELQMQPEHHATTMVSRDIESRINSARGGGQPLADEVREPMEQIFGADFSGVRTHTDTEADTLNRELSAKAFTTGRDIFFRENEYSPGSDGGRKLLAHELTHVVQQTGSMPVQNRVGNEYQAEVYPAEREPDVVEGQKILPVTSVQLNGDDRKPSFWQRTKAALKAFALFVEACASIGSAILEAITAFASISSVILIVQAVFSAIKALFDTVLGFSKFARAVLLAWKGKVTSWFTNLLQMEGVINAIKAITSPAELVQKLFGLAVGFLTTIRGKLMEKGYKIAAACVMGIETVLGWVGTIGTLLIKGASLANLLKLIPAFLKTIRTAVAGAEAANPKERRQGEEEL